ncbi:MAG: FAD:protein FMN transferase [Opitutales bacterium]|nr:FAD:protein FMN transferase [Opitutales bacterium]
MQIYKYTAKAMNATLEISLQAKTEIYARSAAFDMFNRAKMIEETLSMFYPHSEIAIINSLKVGEVEQVLETTAEALAGAMYASQLSKGALDVCMGEYFLKAKGKENIENPRKAQFKFNPENFLIEKAADGKIDLGSIGKGYALDVLAENLVNEWGIEVAHFSFGGSSILALNPPDGKDSWDCTFAGSKVDFKLANCAIGASGTAVQGNHIIDCRTGRTPENMPHRAWAIGENAMLCDAMSTAFMLLTKDEVREICAKENMRAAFQQSENSPVEFLA